MSEMGDDSDGYDIVTPIGLSDKALGKRRVVEEDDRMFSTFLSYPLMIDDLNRPI